MAGEPRVSVAVATRDRTGRLAALLASLARQTLDPASFEVVVAVDGADPETVALLEREARRAPFELRRVALASAGGPARARNAAWRETAAELVAFTDDDCEAEPDWLAALVDAADRTPGAIVQGRTRPIAAELEAAGPLRRTREIDGAPPRWFETCNIAYPRALLESLGGFDEGFREPLGEDTDLGWRGLAAGARHELVPAAVVEHAVEDLDRAAHLRSALVGADSVVVFRRHPGLRAEALDWGVVRNHAHLRLLAAATGLVLARRRPLAALLAVPYAKQLAGRCLRAGGGPALAPQLVCFDLLTLATTIRGDLRHRVLVL